MPDNLWSWLWLSEFPANCCGVCTQELRRLNIKNIEVPQYWSPKCYLTPTNWNSYCSLVMGYWLKHHRNKLQCLSLTIFQCLFYLNTVRITAISIVWMYIADFRTFPLTNLRQAFSAPFHPACFLAIGNILSMFESSHPSHISHTTTWRSWFGKHQVSFQSSAKPVCTPNHILPQLVEAFFSPPGSNTIDTLWPPRHMWEWNNWT